MSKKEAGAVDLKSVSPYWCGCCIALDQLRALPNCDKCILPKILETLERVEGLMEEQMGKRKVI